MENIYGSIRGEERGTNGCTSAPPTAKLDLPSSACWNCPASTISCVTYMRAEVLSFRLTPVSFIWDTPVV
jgi:hypothetical protein